MAFGDVVTSATGFAIGSSGTTVTTASFSATMPGGATNMLVLAAITLNSASVSSVSDSGITKTGSGWVRAGTSDNTTFGNKVELWYCIATASISSKTITSNNNASSSYCTIETAVIEGDFDTATPIDVNANAVYTGTTAPGSVTNTNADVTIGAGARFGGTASPTAGTNFTTLSLGGGYTLLEKRTVTSATTWSVPTSNDGDSNGMVAACFQKAAGAAAVFMPAAGGTALPNEMVTM